MKVTIWIRTNADGDNNKITLRTDVKYESRDTPTIGYFGRKLVKAIERGAAGEVIEVEGEE